MAYIIVVQPAVLSGEVLGTETGLDFGAVTTATCLAAALATAVMALYARTPIAQALGDELELLLRPEGSGIDPLGDRDRDGGRHRARAGSSGGGGSGDGRVRRRRRPVRSQYSSATSEELISDAEGADLGGHASRLALQPWPGRGPALAGESHPIKSA
jgi:hypothetical protein